MTLSGGEPLVQPDFATALLKAGKESGLLTALDTTGHADWEALNKAMEHTDLVLYDVKHLLAEKHQEGTGVGNERILENLRKAAKHSNAHIWLRYPVVPTFNDTDEDLEGLCNLAQELGPAIEKISILPYHKYAEAKYAAIGRDYPFKGVELLSEERVEEMRQKIESRGLKVDVGK